MSFAEVIFGTRPGLTQLLATPTAALAPQGHPFDLGFDTFPEPITEQSGRPDLPPLANAGFPRWIALPFIRDIA